MIYKTTQQNGMEKLYLNHPTNLINPVWVQNPKATQFTTSTFLRNRPLASLKLELSNTLVCGLTIHNTLRNRPLPTSTPNSDTIDHITLKEFNMIVYDRYNQVKSQSINEASLYKWQDATNMYPRVKFTTNDQKCIPKCRKEHNSEPNN